MCAYFGFDDSKHPIEQFDDDEFRKDKSDLCIGCNHYEDFNICTHCSKVVCYACGDDVNTCVGNGCTIVTCGDCRDDENVHHYADWCGGQNYECETRCGDCRFRECSNGTLDCNDCKAMVFDRLLEQNAVKQSMIEQLRLENNQKQVENDQLRQELNQLR